uniref:PI-PLC X domain-containing protein n=1 Tax=Caenorhabditis tropicalis TaxID=1561998 RepID=A0A1I7TCW7_9PELO
MESLFVKVVCIGFLVTCLTVFYEEVVEFVQLQTYGNPYWLNVSQLGECSCDGGKTRNCYPHPDDSQLCGKCFATCPEKETQVIDDPEKKRSDDLVFGLSASIQDVNRLLVLIASIHRNFPTTKLIIFDHANGEILTHHSNVLWLTHDVEILNTKLMQAGPFRRSSKFAVTFISHDKRRKVTSSGYRPYFPTSSLMPHFPMAILLKNEARSLIRWVEKCALTPECWKCDTSSGVTEDCTWMVLHQVASDAQQFRFLGDTNGSINKQTWGPPECDFYCTLWLIGVTIVAVVSFGVLALVLLKKSTKKTK